MIVADFSFVFPETLSITSWHNGSQMVLHCAEFFFFGKLYTSVGFRG